MPMLEVVGKREIDRVLEITDRLGIHREQVVIPLMPRHPGRARRRPDGKLEITVESKSDFEDWLAGLETLIRQADS